MKALTFLLTLIVMVAYGQAQDTLTNAKVIQLAKIGLEPSIIIGKMKTSVNIFDVSTDGLIALSSNGVSAEIINEMMKIDTEAKTAMANQKDMKDPKSMRTPGIYYLDPADEVKPIKRVDPSVISSNKVSASGIAISGPFIQTSPTEKLKSTLAGGKSRLEITATNPVFYFYFENSSNPNADSWFFATATSPNEFALVKLTEKGKSREMIVATANSFQESSGVSDKVKVSFDYVEEAEGVYKVFFKEPLKEGEYCFLYASTIPSRQSNDKVFDFGIHPVK